MQEVLISLGIVILMSAAPLIGLGAPDAWMLVGFWLVVGGMLFGVPTGAVYHVLLRRALLKADALPERWWLQPTSLHGRLPPEQRFWVLGWCFLGAAGFVVTVIGCVAVGIGALRAF